VGNGLNQKLDDHIEELQEEKEFKPSMKEKFLKEQQKIRKIAISQLS